MTTAKSITAKIARRETKLAELTASNESIIAKIHEINARPRLYHETIYQYNLSKRIEREALYTQRIAFDKAINKLHRELWALKDELANLS